jgi:hypothetical protein
MNDRLKTIITPAILLLVGLWIVDKIPFNKVINQQITANIYENGSVVGQTTIVIKGERSNYLFRREDTFTGEFLIPYAEKTDRSDLQTYIKWNGEDNTQSIGYFHQGVMKLAQDMGLVPRLLINDGLTRFAIMLTDHTVLATSDELCELYRKHITWHNDAKATYISAINKIPKID